jgi:CheY-like chemotaxis protein
MKTVLVIDDEPPIARLVAAALKSAGVEHTVDYYSDGAQGKIRAAEGDYDLITLDINMPLMDGFEALEEMKSNPQSADTPVVVLTAEDDDAVHRGLTSAGAAAVVTKPVRIEDLGKLLSRVLSGESVEAARDLTQPAPEPAEAASDSTEAAATPNEDHDLTSLDL